MALPALNISHQWHLPCVALCGWLLPLCTEFPEITRVPLTVPGVHSVLLMSNSPLMSKRILFIHSSLYGHLFECRLWPLWTTLLRVSVSWSLGGRCLQFSWRRASGRNGRLVPPYLTSEVLPDAFPRRRPFHTRPDDAWGFQLLRVLTDPVSFRLDSHSHFCRRGVRASLVCVSLLPGGSEHLCTGVLTIFVPSLEKRLFKSFAHFQMESFVFLVLSCTVHSSSDSY